MKTKQMTDQLQVMTVTQVPRQHVLVQHMLVEDKEQAPANLLLLLVVQVISACQRSASRWTIQS